jgi:hypothetical protein
MTEASFPEPVFMKNCFSVPSLSLAVILDVDAKLDPPPALEIVVSLGSRDKSLATAESIVILLNRLVIAESLLTLESMRDESNTRFLLKVSWACSMTSNSVIEVLHHVANTRKAHQMNQQTYLPRESNASLLDKRLYLFPTESQSENYKQGLEKVGSNPTPT